MKVVKNWPKIIKSVTNMKTNWQIVIFINITMGCSPVSKDIKIESKTKVKNDISLNMMGNSDETLQFT